VEAEPPAAPLTSAEVYTLTLMKQLADSNDHIAALRATIEDVSRGSTHELVRYWIDKTVEAEKQVADLKRSLSIYDQGQVRPVAEFDQLATASAARINELESENIAQAAALSELEQKLTDVTTAWVDLKTRRPGELLEAVKKGGHIGDHVPWLVKDFNVLYATADAVANGWLAPDLPKRVEYLRAQVERLKPAYDETQAVKTAWREEREGR
jgi:hypothetical protein